MPFFNVKNGLSGAATGMALAGPWGALGGGVLGGLGVFGGNGPTRERPTAGPAPTSFGQAANRGPGQSAYNAPDNPMMGGAPGLRPMGMPSRAAQPMAARQPTMPGGMPMQPKSFQNGSATLGLANPTYYSPAPSTRPMAPGGGYGGASAYGGQQGREPMPGVGPIQIQDTYMNQGGGMRTMGGDSPYDVPDPNRVRRTGGQNSDLGIGNTSQETQKLRAQRDQRWGGRALGTGTG